MTYDDWQALKQDCFAALHCALPGNILSFNPETQTAEIRPAVKNFPTLPDVPVFMPVPFEVNPGDACLVVFADRAFDAWFETGDPGEPQSGRMHDLSDGFAFVGWRMNPNAIALAEPEDVS
jgi:hypothetical protein